MPSEVLPSAVRMANAVEESAGPGRKIEQQVSRLRRIFALRKSCYARNDNLVRAMPSDPNKKNFLVQMAAYSQIAFVFPAATVVGWLIGAGLDHWLHTTWLYIVGLIVGIIAGFVELIRLVTSSDFN